MRFVLLAAAIAGFSGGCSLFHHDKKKPVTHMYNGDAPTIRMEDTQAAGGPMQTY
jgi:hypothetical protein